MEKSNDHVAVLYPVAPMSTINIILRPDTLVPVRNYAVWYGAFGDWYSSGGESGVEPNEEVGKLLDLYGKMLSSRTVSEATEYGNQMLELHKENIWQIGYASAAPTLIGINSDLMNFPDTCVFSDEFRDMGIAHLQNLYYASDKH